MSLDLSSPKIIKEILTKYGTKPSKGMGQNFLINRQILKKIIETGEIKPKDIVLEIGPGIGTLTQELAKNAKKIIAVEKDEKMCEILKKTLSDFENIEIIHGDILKFENLEIERLIENCKLVACSPEGSIENYKIVANIPYYITSPLIRKFLEFPKPPHDFVLMVQKEVAQRICAKPPSPPTNFEYGKGENTKRKNNPKLVGGKMSLLSVSVQFYADAKIISYVKKDNFWPKPKVDSAIIKITPRGLTSREAGGQTSPDLFFKIVKAGFSHPRKQLSNNLSALKKTNNIELTKNEISDWLLKNKISPNQRAETLSVADWINLTNSF